ncbi:AP-3 complex subunit delta-1 [Geranomyces michiganensis]|nr:AP-3 complex subunit delta-1 [Geranomyces michiganensis]
MARKFLVGGNWKMNGSNQLVAQLVKALNEGSWSSDVECVIAPPAPYLASVRSSVRETVGVAAQNVWVDPKGAFTGETSTEMLKDLNIGWVIIGHSERRSIYGESDELVGKKVAAAVKAGLKVIACCGESEGERDANKTTEVVFRQIKAISDQLSAKDWASIVIAYEPVWAIGTGKVATPQQAQEVHQAIRGWLAKNVSSDISEATRILYGGSVSAKSSPDLQKEKDIDGFLVGGASLKDKEFLEILNSRQMRANKKTEEKYIAVCLDEIRNEVRKNDPDIKAQAVRKLIYLHMHGYDMAWASFHVIEVMSSPKIHYKRIGYQAAAVSFKQDTDVLMLCTNLIKKDLSSNNYNETALALHGLGMIVTPDLGRDLVTDLIAMMNHSRPYIRKRVILVLYRVFLKYPEALRLAFPRLKDKLDDPDPAVVSAVVNVICELARRNPKSYLPLAPQLYGLLTNSTNNWMLIKIIKLFASLTPLEPRLTKKLVPQITNLIQSTSAMSLLYECIHTVIVGGMISLEQVGGENEAQDEALAKLCTSKLKIFIGEPDQNLKYLGLYALSKLLAVRPKAVVEHRDTILSCLDDADVSIRMRALDIVTGMVRI